MDDAVPAAAGVPDPALSAAAGVPDPALGAARPRRRLRGPLGCLALLVILAVLAAAVYILPSPWALHIGGRFTPGRAWHGYGVVSATNGGRYALYVSFSADGPHEDSSSDPYRCSLPVCDSIHGDGKLCTISGTTYPLQLEGDVHAWWSTDGARTAVRLLAPGAHGPTFVALLDGTWHGPELPLTDTTEWTTALTREGAIREARSTTDAGTARTTLRYGTEDDFNRACRSLPTS